MQTDQGLVTGERGEAVVSDAEGFAQSFGQPRRDPGAELRMGVQPGADRRAADGQSMDRRQRGAQRLLGEGELRRVAAELLAKGERRGVLQVRAADLEDTGERRRLGQQGRAQPRE